jgi:succinoglycan biosynthesis transport protein ExoP
VLAELPGRRAGRTGLGSLDRAELEAFSTLLGAVGASRTVLATGYEGKSAVAAGLAAAVVAGGRKAVLVESDLARPTLASRLGLAEAPGLAEYLRYEAEAAQILQPVVLAGPATGRATAPLICIAAGTPTSHGPTLLASQSYRHVTAKLRNAYDVVVVDGPPLDDADSLIAAAAQADMTLACCSGSEVPKRVRSHLDGLVVPDEPA